MVHFSLNGRKILLGQDEWVDAPLAAARLDEERQQVEHMLQTLFKHEICNVDTLHDQKAALDAAIALCERQAAH
jgi:hypothetical protein